MCQSRKSHTHYSAHYKVINVCVDDDTNWRINDKIDTFRNHQLPSCKLWKPAWSTWSDTFNTTKIFLLTRNTVTFWDRVLKQRNTPGWTEIQAESSLAPPDELPTSNYVQTLQSVYLYTGLYVCEGTNYFCPLCAKTNPCYKGSLHQELPSSFVFDFWESCT